MTLIIILILAAVLIVFAFFAVKRASSKAGAVNTGSRPVVPPGGATPPATHQPGATDAANPNPTGSIPDKPGTKGDGSSALSGGGQG